jgi:hypothetical protein
MPEAESELIGGYHTEYSGMKFALFFAAEYMSMIAVSAIAAAMFFGGYNGPLPVSISPLFGPVNMLIKIILFLSGMVWVRATLPRFRYDRLMQFGWKVMFPLALLGVAWTAITLVVADTLGGSQAYQIISGLVFGLIVVSVMVQLWRQNTDVFEHDLGDSRSGLGWAILYGIGGLVSAPFALFDWLREQRGGFVGFWDATRRENEERLARQQAAQAAAAASSAEPPAQSGDGR